MLPDTTASIHQALVTSLKPALEIGAASGLAGFAFGGVAGIFSSAHPTLFATVAGGQCFFLGTSFFYTRGVLLAGVLKERSRRNEMSASCAAGFISGAAAGALRSRSNVVPGAIMVGLIGLSGQAVYHTVESSPTTGEKKPMIDRIAEARWLPLRTLSDEEYEKMLSNKLLDIKTEIALIDRQISSLQDSIADISINRSLPET